MSVALAAVGIILMLSIDPWLTLVALVPLPFVTVVVRYFGHAIHTRFEKIQEQLSDISAIAQESLAGVRVVRAYGQEAFEIEKFRHANEEYVLRAIRAGGAGYVLKDASPAELEQAIRAVAAGDKYLSPAMSRHVVDAYLERVTDDHTAGPRLSPRQRQVLQMIAEGRSTKEIAAALSLSIKTVETHRAQLMERLDIHDVAGLVRYAIRMGLVRSDP